MLWKIEGLDDDQLCRPVGRSGTSLLGLLKHLAGAELGWFCLTFGRECEPLPFEVEGDEASGSWWETPPLQTTTTGPARWTVWPV
ncbi:DUF664 domain-containing protein [Streptomyces niveus]|uniref:mycothiol transferase n=1 Tax=Streptomyces niveus TaxID=193462 RepID=UPI00383382A2